MTKHSLLLVVGLLAVVTSTQAGEIRSDHPCILGAVRAAMAEAAKDRTVGATCEELEAGLNLDVASQSSIRLERLQPQRGIYHIAIDASLRTTNTYVYEAFVNEAEDGKTCEVQSITRIGTRR